MYALRFFDIHWQFTDILSANQESGLLCPLAKGVSKILWGWMQAFFFLCLPPSHPLPLVLLFDLGSAFTRTYLLITNNTLWKTHQMWPFKSKSYERVFFCGTFRGVARNFWEVYSFPNWIYPTYPASQIVSMRVIWLNFLFYHYGEVILSLGHTDHVLPISHVKAV